MVINVHFAKALAEKNTKMRTKNATYPEASEKIENKKSQSKQFQ